MKPNRLKQLSEKEFLERLEKSRKQSKDGKGKDAKYVVIAGGYNDMAYSYDTIKNKGNPKKI